MPPAIEFTRIIASVSGTSSPGRSPARNTADVRTEKATTRTVEVRRYSGSLNGTCAKRVATNSCGRNQPPTRSAGIAPMTHAGAPSAARNGANTSELWKKASPPLTRMPL